MWELWESTAQTDGRHIQGEDKEEEKEEGVPAFTFTIASQVTTSVQPGPRAGKVMQPAVWTAAWHARDRIMQVQPAGETIRNYAHVCGKTRRHLYSNNFAYLVNSAWKVVHLISCIELGKTSE